MSIQIANENEIVEDIWNAFTATLENNNEVSEDEESEDEESEDEESEDEESEDELELQMLKWDGVKYLREIHTNIVYTFEIGIIDPVRLGVWNAETKCVEFDNEVLLK